MTAALGALLTLSSAAIADPKVSVTPKLARPGDAVLVTVTGSKEPPKGEALGSQLQFWKAKAKDSYQAVFAVPLDVSPKAITVTVENAKLPGTVKVSPVTFPEAKVVVEEEMANPPKAERDRIDADNKAILDALATAKGEPPQFTRSFQRPSGAISSTFGEWRTFNDGHRSQHLGLDLAAKEGAKIKAVNAGTVALVHDGFLTGNLVVISHGAGLASAYYHLSKTSVAVGDKVVQGAEIGLAGKTGRTTGAHLHVSVRVPGGFVDPARFFALKLLPATK
ncbi:MAG: Peptidase [Myxococcales bacterium]|nr:Peptidase [Myxococcales bacterium]